MVGRAPFPPAYTPIDIAAGRSAAQPKPSRPGQVRESKFQNIRAWIFLQGKEFSRRDTNTLCRGPTRGRAAKKSEGKMQKAKLEISDTFLEFSTPGVSVPAGQGG